jgi:hypothetical protein
MSHSPPAPAHPGPEMPLTREEVAKISETLERLIHLILPLHQLLEAQSGLETGITGRLEEIMTNLGWIAASMQSSAEGLTRLVEGEGQMTALAQTLTTLDRQQQHQDLKITEIGERLDLLIDWLGAPPHREAVRTS